MNTARAASPFVVALGAIAAGNTQVTASNNASSHIPTAFMGLILSPIFDQSEPRDVSTSLALWPPPSPKQRTETRRRWRAFE
ncbi:hypothetical protein, partial [Candidatus Binatus sp.]